MSEEKKEKCPMCQGKAKKTRCVQHTCKGAMYLCECEQCITVFRTIDGIVTEIIKHKNKPMSPPIPVKGYAR